MQKWSDLVHDQTINILAMCFLKHWLTLIESLKMTVANNW